MEITDFPANGDRLDSRPTRKESVRYVTRRMCALVLALLPSSKEGATNYPQLQNCDYARRALFWRSVKHNLHRY